MRPMMVPMLQPVLDDILTDGSTANVLFLGNNATPTSGADANVMAFLQAKYGASSVTYIQGSASASSDANGRTLIVISSTLSSNTVRGKFNTAPVPLMNWEEALMKSSPGDFQFGTTTAKPVNDSINVVDDTHPIMVQAGLSNGVQLIKTAASEQNCVNGSVAGGVDSLAEAIVDPACKSVTVGEQGALGVDLVPFPARRGMFPITDSSFNDLNADGIALFNAMLDWLDGVI